ncbi:MAG TPA: hypothetical protein VMB50_02120 [Myxococcales bacterium]|nr:hypothetical protein [Myxococcales bacterium]
MRRLFVSQELLDQWAGQGKIELSGNHLKILSENRTFQLRPGARFLSLAAGQDANKLVGKVKSDDQLQDLGGELYMNSVLVGEDAYDVQAGFLAEVADPPAGAFPEEPPAPSAPAQRSQGPGITALAEPLPAAAKPDDEKAALAKFLLENLT